MKAKHTPGPWRVMKTVTLVTRYPCCGGRSLIRAVPAIPRETYERRCAACGGRFEVERRTAKEVPGRRIDILEWTCVRGES